MIQYSNGYPMYQSIKPRGAQPKHTDFSNHLMLPKRLQMAQNPEDVDEADYMKSMYSVTCKRIQVYVDEACDKMDYEGSMMFDQYPDKETLENLTNNIFDRVLNDDLLDHCSADPLTEAMENMGVSPRHEWLQEIIKIMLLNEIFGRRRLRHYNRYGCMNNYFEPYQPAYENYGYNSDYYGYYFE